MQQHRTPLDAYRVSSGMTWDAMGRRCGVSGETLRAVGTGRRPASATTAHAVAAAFGIDLAAPAPEQTRESARERLAMAARDAQTRGLNLPSLDDHSLLEDAVRDAATAYPVTPLPHLVNGLVSLQDATWSAIDAGAPGDGRRLYALAAMSAALLGKASHDLGDPSSAMAQVRTARLLADHAGHVQLSSWLDGLAAMITYWSGRPRESLRAARHGLDTGATGPTALWLTVSESRAAARLGQPADALDAARRADHIADTLTHDDDLAGIGGLFDFTPERGRYYVADGLAWLPSKAGETAAAAAAADDAAAAFRDRDAEHWAFGDAAGAQCAQATARLRGHDITGAQDALSDVLTMPREQRIRGVIDSVARVSRVLDTAPASPARDELADALEDFVAQPMVMTP